MTFRLPFAIALVGLCTLAACDSSATPDGGGVAIDDSEGITGVYETTVTFEADTLMPEWNHRIKSDYTVRHRFDVVHDDGLMWGYLRTYFDGTLIVREAGYLADTLRFNPDVAIQERMVGTFAWPEVELDGFGLADEESIWNFDKVASQLRLNADVVHRWEFVYINNDSTGFEFDIGTAEPDFTASRRDGEPVQGFDPTDYTFLPGGLAGDSVMALTSSRGRLVLATTQPRTGGTRTRAVGRTAPAVDPRAAAVRAGLLRRR